MEHSCGNAARAAAAKAGTAAAVLLHVQLVKAATATPGTAAGAAAVVLLHVQLVDTTRSGMCGVQQFNCNNSSFLCVELAGAANSSAHGGSTVALQQLQQQLYG
jgi:hypothetical protein